MDPVRPVSGSDRALPPVEPTHLTPLQREEERKRRERERERRRKGQPKPRRTPDGRLDIRA